MIHFDLIKEYEYYSKDFEKAFNLLSKKCSVRPKRILSYLEEAANSYGFLKQNINIPGFQFNYDEAYKSILNMKQESSTISRKRSNSSIQSYDYDKIKMEDLTPETKKILEKNKEMLQKINNGINSKEKPEKVFYAYVSSFIEECSDFILSGMSKYGKAGNSLERSNPRLMSIVPLISGIQNQKIEIEDLQRELDALFSQSEVSKEEFKELIHKHMELKEKITIERITLDSTQKQVQELIKQNHELEEQLFTQGKSTVQAKKYLEEETEGLIKRRAEVSLMVKKSEKESMRLAEENAAVRAEIVQLDTKMRLMEAEQKDMKDKLANIHIEKDDLERNIMGLQAEIDDLEFHWELIVKDTEETRNRREEVRARREELAFRFEEAKKNAAEEFTGLRDEDMMVNELKRKISMLNDNLGSAEDTLKTSNLELSRLQLQYEFLLKKREIYEETIEENSLKISNINKQLSDKTYNTGLPPIKEIWREDSEKLFEYEDEDNNPLESENRGSGVFNHLPSTYTNDSLATFMPNNDLKRSVSIADSNITFARRTSQNVRGSNGGKALDLGQIAEIMLELGANNRILRDDKSRLEVEFKKSQNLKREIEKMNRELEKTTTSMQQLKHSNIGYEKELSLKQKELNDLEKAESLIKEKTIRTSAKVQMINEMISQKKQFIQSKPEKPRERNLGSSKPQEVELMEIHKREPDLEIGKFQSDSIRPLLEGEFNPYQDITEKPKLSLFGYTFDILFFKIFLACSLPLLIGYFLFKLNIL